jgi:hypothetical protein
MGYHGAGSCAVDSGYRWAGLATGLARASVVGAIIFGLWIDYAYPRDPDGRYANSPLKSWFDSLKSGKGPCCSDADGSVLKDVDWESRDGKYRVRIDGKWIEVEDSALVKEPNKFGQAMVWPYYLNGEPIVRCFIPGAGI